MKKIVLSLALLSISIASVAQLVTPFTARYSVTQKGGIVMLANTASGCGSGTTHCGSKNCVQAHAELPPMGTSVDNDFVNTYVDIDNDAATFMSSSDSLNLPSCSNVTFAGLYWGAGGTGGNNPDPNGSHWATRNTLKLKLNNGTYQTLTADASFDNTTGYKSYHNFKDITSIVTAAGGKGRYTIANMPMLNDNGTGNNASKNRWGGWVIVIVYKNDLMPLKNLTVFNGLTNVDANHDVTDLPITGFFTPPTGPVSLQLGLVTYDGDRGYGALGGSCAQTYVGDSLLFRSAGGFIPVSDAIHPANDVFNSTISNNGSLTPYRNPSYNNTLGHDANVFVPNNTSKNYIGNGATSATLRQTTSGETYLTQVVTTAIDVYDVDLRGGLSVVDLNGGFVQPGDTLEYTLSVKNIGSDQSINTYITDTLASNAVYVPGSIRITSGANSGNKTDLSGDDQAEFFAASSSLKVRVGVGANSTTGGFVNNSPIAIDSTQIKFRVTATTNCTVLLCNNVIHNRFWVYGTGVLSTLTRVAGSNPIIFDANGCPVAGTTNTLVSAATCGGPSATNSSPVCERGTFNLNVGTVSGATYLWSGPNSYTSTSQNPTITNATPAMSGTYTVTITTGVNCFYTAMTTVLINGAPTPIVTGNTPLCINNTLNLSTPAIAGVSYNWSGPNGFTSSSQNPSILNVTLATAGTYSLTETYTSTGCVTLVGTMAIVVDNIVQTTPTASNNSPFCAGNTLNLSTPTVAGVTYHWAGPNGFTSSSQNPSISNATPAMSGTYSVTITNVSPGCTSAVGTTTVVVNALPSITVNASSTSVCNGSSVTLSGNGAANYSWTSGISNGVSFVPASSGSYTVTGTDGNGCVNSASVLINVNSVPSSNSVVSNPISCNGGTTTVVITATGGTAPYTGVGSYTVSSGNYSYTVTDANGCTATTTGSVSEPSILTASSTSGTISCNGGTTTVVVSATGGTAPYTGAGSYTVSSGNYSYTVTDANGCTATTTGSVSEPSMLTASSTAGTIACNGGTATVVITAAGGTAPYTGEGSFTVSAGNYSYTVTDANGCTATTTGTVSEPTVLTASASAGTIACNGGTTTVVVTATGGTAPYTGAGTFTVSVGNYSYTVTDANGCTATTTGSVSEPSMLTASSTSGTISCNGGTTTVVVTAIGGTVPYIGEGSFTVSAGNYSYTVVDANGCSVTTNVNVSEPTILTATSTAGTIGCNGGTTTVIVTATGGTAPYTGEGSFTVSAGNYSYNVTDANGCSFITTVTVSEPTVLTASSTAGAIGCNGGTTTVIVTAAGGTAPYIGEGSFTVSAGNYSYTVSDANGCTAITTGTIIANPAPTVNSVSNQVLCNGASTLDVIFSGTVAGTSFDWTNSNSSIGLASNGTGNLGSFVVTNSGTTVVTSTITVIPNANGCIGSAISFTITVNPSPETPIVNNNTPICEGGTINLTSSAAIGALISWSGPNGFSSSNQNPVIAQATIANAGTYSLTVTNPSTGCVSNAGTTNVIVNAQPATPVASSNSPVCAGSSIDFTASSSADAIYNWSGPGFNPSSTFQNPSITGATLNMAGTYTLTVTSNGCTSNPATLTVIVNNCGNVDLSVVKTVNNSHPIVGTNVVFTIVVTNSGSNDATGVNVTEMLQSGYTYVSSTVTAGTYDNATGTWTIGSIISGGTETLTVTATVNMTGSYSNTATVTFDGVDSKPSNNSSTIETTPEVLNIPEGFSPNGDGVNDVFVIRGMENYPNNTFVIFNRWGDKVYEASPYLNNWDGKSTTGLRIGGSELPIGTYFYVLDLGDGSKAIKGTIYLNR